MAQRRKLYRTMQGRMVDIEKLRSANESVQAVGNMNVNARGDVLGKGGQIVTPKETVIKSITSNQEAKLTTLQRGPNQHPSTKFHQLPKRWKQKK